MIIYIQVMSQIAFRLLCKMAKFRDMDMHVIVLLSKSPRIRKDFTGLVFKIPRRAPAIRVVDYSATDDYIKFFIKH